jgi:hypothetical protein
MEISMANPQSFEEIMNLKLDDVEDAKPFPVGTYIWMINGQPESGKSSQKQTPYWRFRCKPIQAMEDVDREALEEAGGLQREMDLDFYITPDSASILRNFLRDTLGIRGGLSVTQAVAEATGQQFKGHVRHEPFTRNDGTAGLRARIDSTTKA